MAGPVAVQDALAYSISSPARRSRESSSGDYDFYRTSRGMNPFSNAPRPPLHSDLDEKKEGLGDLLGEIQSNPESSQSSEWAAQFSDGEEPGVQTPETETEPRESELKPMDEWTAQFSDDILQEIQGSAGPSHDSAWDDQFSERSTPKAQSSKLPKLLSESKPKYTDAEWSAQFSDEPNEFLRDPMLSDSKSKWTHKTKLASGDILQEIRRTATSGQGSAWLDQFSEEARRRDNAAAVVKRLDNMALEGLDAARKEEQDEAMQGVDIMTQLDIEHIEAVKEIELMTQKADQLKAATDKAAAAREFTAAVKKATKQPVTISRQKERRVPRKLKMELPMILMGETIRSTADSGSEENIISKDVIRALGLTIEDSPEHQREFRMGNNRIVRALGRIGASCSFARDQNVQLQCWFYVFNTLITPLIMGMAFLEQTETLTKHKHRLQPREMPFGGPLICASVNNPKTRLRCLAVPLAIGTATFKFGNPTWEQKYMTLVNADTGSEVDLVSLEWCKKRKLSLSPVEEEYSQIQFADGSIDSLVGQVKIRIIIGRWAGDVLERTFYVLPDLTCNMLFGEEFLDEFDAFDTCRDSIYLEDDPDLPQVNTIVWLKAHERFFLQPFNSRAQDNRNNPSVREWTALEIDMGLDSIDPGAEEEVTATNTTTDLKKSFAGSGTGLEDDSIESAGIKPVDSQRPLDALKKSVRTGKVARKVGMVKSVYHWLLICRRQIVQGLRAPPALTMDSELDLDTQIDELDARENRRREQAKKMIRSLPPLDVAKATELEVKKMTAFHRDREILTRLRDKYRVELGYERTS